MKKRHSRIYRISVIVLILGSLIEVGMLLIIYCFPNGTPVIQEYSFVVAQGEDMEPEIPKGALVITKESQHNREYGQGDIIAYQTIDKQIQISRVVERLTQNNEIYYQTKGDANETINDSFVNAEAVLGSFTTQLPMIGSICIALSSQMGIITVCIVLILCGFIVFVHQDEEQLIEEEHKGAMEKETIELQEAIEEYKNTYQEKEPSTVHMAKITKDEIHTKTIHCDTVKKKVVQASLQQHKAKPAPIQLQTKEQMLHVEPIRPVKQQPVQPKVQSRPVSQMNQAQEKRERLRPEMFQPRKPIRTQKPSSIKEQEPKQAMKPRTEPLKQAQPVRPQPMRQAQPVRPMRPQPQRVIVTEKPTGKPAPKIDVREQLALQRQKVKEEMERMERAKALREAKEN